MHEHKHMHKHICNPIAKNLVNTKRIDVDYNIYFFFSLQSSEVDMNTLETFDPELRNKLNIANT